MDTGFPATMLDDGKITVDVRVRDELGLEKGDHVYVEGVEVLGGDE